MKLNMVSENLFNEVLVSNEQNSLTRIFKSPNLDEKSSQLQMSELAIDIPKSSTLLKTSENHLNSVSNANSETLKDSTSESENLTSDIELSIDDYEEKDDERQTSTINIKTNGLLPKNDVDSIESIDHDLKTTANLVGKQFLQDDFDSNDSLDIDSISRLNKSVSDSNHSIGDETKLEPALCNNNIQKTISSDNCANQLLPNPVVEEMEISEKSTNEVDKNSETISVKVESVENNENTTEVTCSQNDENVSNPIVPITNLKQEKEETPSTENVVQVPNDSPPNCDELVNEDNLNSVVFNETTNSNADSTKEVVKSEETNSVLVDKISTSCENPDESPLCPSAAELENTIESSSTLLQKSAESYSDKISSMEIEISNEQPNLTESILVPTENPFPVTEHTISQSQPIESSSLLEENPISIPALQISTIPEMKESSSSLVDVTSTDLEMNESSSPQESEKSLPTIEKTTQPDSEESIIPKIKETDSQLENKESTLLDTQEKDSQLEREKITVPENSQVNPPPEDDESSVEIQTTDIQAKSPESDLQSVSTVNCIDKRNENESDTQFSENLSTPVVPTLSTPNIPDIESNVHTTSTSNMDVDGGPVLKETIEPILNTVNSVDSDDDCAILHCSEPKSVESAELQIIDLADPEIVDLEDNQELIEIDSVSKTNQVHDEKQKSPEWMTDIDAIALEETRQRKDNQDRDVEEIQSTSIDHAADDIMEVDSTEIEVPISVDSESRKRRLDSDNSSTQCIKEKRRKSNDESHSESVSGSPEVKKKSTMNIARKHTSSSNVSKTVREIEKKIAEDLTRANEKARSRESTPSADTVDEYDLIINDDRNSNAADENEIVADDSEKIVLKSDALSKESLNSIFKVMKEKLTRRQLEEIVIQKCCEMISDSSEIGSLRRQVYDLQQTENFRKQKMLLLEKQIHQLKAVCQKYLEQVKDPKNENKVYPIKITRSVGLQVAIESTAIVDVPVSPVSLRNDNRLKKLLTSTASGSITRNPESLNPSKNSVAIPSSSKSSNGNATSSYNDISDRVTSPLASSSSVPGSGKNPATKPIVPSTETVIDLTDKDDKIENEAQTAAKNIMRNVNGSLVTYVPVKLNQDQHKILKPGTQLLVNGQLVTVRGKTFPGSTHPAPIPQTPPVVPLPDVLPLPPKPILKVAKNGNGIMVSWNMPSNISYATVTKYQLYAYQETSVPPSEDLWKFVGDVHALALPMACTLTQFVEGYRYHFIVRAVDKHRRVGPFSGAESISL